MTVALSGRTPGKEEERELMRTAQRAAGPGAKKLLQGHGRQALPPWFGPRDARPLELAPTPKALAMLITT